MHTCPYWQLNQIFAAHGQHPDLKPFATALMLVAAEGTDKVSSSEHAELARPVSQEVDSYGIVPSGAAVPEVSTSAGTIRDGP